MPPTFTEPTSLDNPFASIFPYPPRATNSACQITKTSASSSCLTLLSLVKVSFDLGIPLPRNVAACSSSRSCESPICTLHTLFHERAMRVSLYNPFASPMLITLKTVGKWNGTRGYNELKRFVEYFAKRVVVISSFFFF